MSPSRPPESRLLPKLGILAYVSGTKEAAVVSSREQGGQSKPGKVGIQVFQTKKPAQGMEADGRRQSNACGYAKCMGGNPPQKFTFNPRYRGDNQKEGKRESKAKAKSKTKKPAQGREVEGCRQSNASGYAKCVGVTLPKLSFTPLR